MKKILLTCIATLMAFPVFAQNGYDGPGFYRIQNQGKAGRFLSLRNDKISEESRKIDFSSGTAAHTGAEALELVRSKDGNPGTILYISGNASGFTIEAQGINTDKLLNDFHYGDLTLRMSNKEELCSTYQGMQVDLIDYCYMYPITKDGFCGVVGTSYVRQLDTEDKPYALWTFKKIDNESNFFGINPSEGIQIDDKYYTTIFATFAFQLREGLKAYYIDQHNYSKNIAEPIAELKEITDGKIPASTPVIIECSSSSVANNKVTLLNETISPITGNELKGRIFSFIPTEDEDQSMKNALEFNKNTMRVLGVKDGKLAMVTDNNNSLKVVSKKSGDKEYYIPANKAYLAINSSDATATDKGIKLLLPEEYAVATSINKVMNEDLPAKEGVYTLTGVKVKDTNSTEDLPSGIYIIGGKKQVVK